MQWKMPVSNFNPRLKSSRIGYRKRSAAPCILAESAGHLTVVEWADNGEAWMALWSVCWAYFILYYTTSKERGANG